jgi:uncharacterized protein YjiS (DUF1127 family)
MRNYVLWEAQSREAYGRFTMLVRLVRNWRQRKDLKKLWAMDDHMLRDIGVTRDEIARLARLPLTADVEWERQRMERLR